MINQELNLGFLRAKPVLVATGNDKIIRLILVGCGGTGSHLASGIARIAYEIKRIGRKVEVQFWDFDRVEEKNVPRQNFSPGEIGKYKAEVLAFRYSAAWGIPISVYREPFDPDKLAKQLPSFNTITILLGAVDNAAGRNNLAKALNSNQHLPTEAPRMWAIDAGNGKSHCQVLIGSHNRVEDLSKAFTLSCCALPSPYLQHPELLEPLPEELEEARNRMSCAELMEANAQSLTINALTATIANDALTRLITGKLNYFAAYADQPSCSVRARYTNPEEVAAAIGKTTAFFSN